MVRRALLGAGSLLVLLSACGGGGGSAADTTAPGSSTPVDTTPTTLAAVTLAPTTASATTATATTAAAPTTLPVATATFVGLVVGGSGGGVGEGQTDTLSEVVREEDGSCAGWDGPGGGWTAGVKDGGEVKVFGESKGGKVLATGHLGPGKAVDVDPPNEQWQCELSFTIDAVPKSDRYFVEVGGLPRVEARPGPGGALVIPVNTQASADRLSECVDEQLPDAVGEWKLGRSVLVPRLPEHLLGRPADHRGRPRLPPAGHRVRPRRRRAGGQRQDGARERGRAPGRRHDAGPGDPGHRPGLDGLPLRLVPWPRTFARHAGRMASLTALLLLESAQGTSFVVAPCQRRPRLAVNEASVHGQGTSVGAGAGGALRGTGASSRPP